MYQIYEERILRLSKGKESIYLDELDRNGSRLNQLLKISDRLTLGHTENADLITGIEGLPIPFTKFSSSYVWATSNGFIKIDCPRAHSLEQAEQIAFSILNETGNIRAKSR